MKTQKMHMAAQDTVIRRVQLIQNDPEVRARIEPILKLDDFQRKSMQQLVGPAEPPRPSLGFAGGLGMVAGRCDCPEIAKNFRE